MFAASKTDSVSGGPPDGQFNYVTMLLHGDGTNGAQNNTFLDSSTNNFSITRTGNATQGSFSPYGSNWSNWFNGAQDYLTGPTTNSAFDFGSGDWTIETWAFPTSFSSQMAVLISLDNATGESYAIGLLINATGSVQVYQHGGSYFINSTSSTGVVSLNTWSHIAAVRSGSNFAIFVNGTRVASVSGVSGTQSANRTVNIGQDPYANNLRYQGYLSNLRVVKGTAVYSPTSSTITVPTTPLTAISGTSLLTCQSSRFIDNSANNFTITVNGRGNEGHPIALKFTPFGTSAAYSTSVVGGSFSSDGVVGGSDYLSVTVTGKSARTASFTYECWFYETAHEGRDRHLFTTRTSDNNAGFDCRVNSNGTINLQRGGSTDFFTSTAAANVACWNHLAIVRNGDTNLTIYLNGVSIGTSSLGYDLTATAYKLGINYVTDDPWKGYITDFRYTKAAVYTANFTPNTTPLTAITDTALLLNFTNGAIIDNAMLNDLETVGNAQISTSVKKFGTGSVYINSASAASYLTSFNKDAINFGTGDFTIEAWIYPTQYTDDSLICKFVTGGNVFFVMINGGRFVIVTNGYTSPSLGYSSFGSLSLNTWTYITLTRVSGTCFGYINGTKSGSSYSFATAITPNQVIVGESDANRYIGYIDDFRITKGYARYTATFTPPTSALSDTGPY
jgi:hypothetical protein